MPIEFRRYWLGTHFFNPVRYMKLLESFPARIPCRKWCSLWPTLANGPWVGVVHCKDTPAFIANRFGNWGGPKGAKLMLELGLTFSVVPSWDRRPAGGTVSFGLIDLVGLDIAVASTGTVRIT